MTDNATDKPSTNDTTNDQPDVGIDAQLNAIELLVTNHSGWVDTLQELVEKRKRTPEELKMAKAYLPAARQAIKTLRFVRDNAAAVRALAATKGASGDADTRDRAETT